MLTQQSAAVNDTATTHPVRTATVHELTPPTPEQCARVVLTFEVGGANNEEVIIAALRRAKAGDLPTNYSVGFTDNAPELVEFDPVTYLDDKRGKAFNTWFTTGHLPSEMNKKVTSDTQAIAAIKEYYSI